ncbi:hypothetical protein N617_gp07 [Stygiolobus rod-shaped virus]|uniref:Uncharacterized protein n=1 Tax=Stygiolobus rod-shaped virus TaxID=537009 RepID=B6EFB3_9VIRU|nr:hypothetical protein N617_gp07 [Stygiolobus rod-shaped virus]CAQ58448.1 hypothetical protein [Stygiolobus rod-shaped virus]
MSQKNEELIIISNKVDKKLYLEFKAVAARKNERINRILEECMKKYIEENSKS